MFVSVWFGYCYDKYWSVVFNVNNLFDCYYYLSLS